MIEDSGAARIAELESQLAELEAENARLRRRSRALDGVLRVHERAHEEIAAIRALLGGDGDG